MIPPCLTLSNIGYVSRVKWKNPGKGIAPSPKPRCSSYWKGSLWVALDYSHQLYFSFCYNLKPYNCVQIICIFIEYLISHNREQKTKTLVLQISIMTGGNHATHHYLGIVVREFVLQSRYYVHFRPNTLGKGMNPLILPPAMGK